MNQIILDNIVFSLQKNGGVSIVWQNLINNLLKQSIDFHCIEYENENLARKELQLDKKYIDWRSKTLLKIKRYLDVSVDTKNPFVFHSSYYRISNNKHAHNITTVHDFIYEIYRAGKLSTKVHTLQKHHAMQKSDYIVCISENTRNDLFKLYPDIPKNKVVVIFNGVSDEFHPLPENATYDYKDYILYVGSRDPHKKFDFLIDAVKETKYKLLLCTRPLDENEKNYLDQELGKDRYKVVSYISTEELNKIYNSVFCAVYPSIYEGFGLPILEAQRAACPIIALNSSSIPEVMGGSPLLLENLDITEFKQKIGLVESYKIREEIIENGLLNSSKFSWERMSSEYLQLYNLILSSC